MKTTETRESENNEVEPHAGERGSASRGRRAMRVIGTALLVGTMGSAGNVVLAGDGAPAADNSARNVRDRDGSTLTSGDQSETESDRTLTQDIRKAVVADDSLSMTAKNVKIITINGIVTLRGPVKTEQERTKIAATATQIAGPGKVQNHLEVASN